MLTRNQALQHLHLNAEASEPTGEAIEKAYQRMVRRYPPEFHPDRFRLIDESYRTLTSLAFLVESVFEDQTDDAEAKLAQSIADLPLTAEADAVPASLRDIRRRLLREALWPDAGA